jgi:hypothetical protein
MSIASGGAGMAVDWEQRIDVPRLRLERLERPRASLAASDLGALLLFDPNNIRYVTSSHIGEWARDNNAREVWPTAEELGFPSEESCFGLQFGHGLGVGLYGSPMISRLHSFHDPVEIEEGMVFALETYCPAADGRSAARIEEEVLVTADGCEVLTKFPADELLVTGRTYVRDADVAELEARSGAGGA